MSKLKANNDAEVKTLIHRTIRKTYFIELLKEIPNILQIITFSSFLALILQGWLSTIVLLLSITILTVLLLEWYFLSKDKLRTELIVYECILAQDEYGIKHIEAMSTAMTIEPKLFAYNMIASFIFGALAGLIALRISQLIIG